MKIIDELTREQKDQMIPYRDKWIEIGLKTGETDFETFDRYMPICYEKAKLPYPKNVIRVSSPLVGAIAASIANSVWAKIRDAVGGAVDDAVRGAVGDAVGGAVDDAVDDAVRGAVGGAVGDAVGGAVDGAVDDAVDGAVRGAVRGAVGGAVRGAVDDAVDGAVRGAVDDAVDGAVRGAVGGAVDDAVRGAVDDAVDDAVRGAVDDAVGGAVDIARSIAQKYDVVFNGWHYWLGGQFWVGGWYWGVAFVQFFFDICKLKLAKDIMERAEAYRKVCESVSYIWPNRDFVMVCERPIRISRNTLGRLHSETAKAIEYPDGWGLYYLNGVKFDETLWRKVVSKNMPFSEIMAIVDVDQRTQAMKYGDFHDFAKHQKAVKLDHRMKLDVNGEEVNYELWQFPQGNVFNQKVYFMWYQCPSTRNEYTSGVWESKTVAEAMARKQGITEELWNLQIPLVHES